MFSDNIWMRNDFKLISPYQINQLLKNDFRKKRGSTEIWTRIAGFKVQSANRYTIEPRYLIYYRFKLLDHSIYIKIK